MGKGRDRHLLEKSVPTDDTDGVDGTEVQFLHLALCVLGLVCRHHAQWRSVVSGGASVDEMRDERE